MYKSIRLRILAVITIFLVSAMSTYTYAEGLSKKSDNNPSVHATKTFLIYAKKGNFKVFDFSGKLVKNEVSKDFRNGELLFIITGPKSAIFSANTGISEVEFVKDTNSVTFIETTPSENKHIMDKNVMIIEDKWDAKEGGFKFTYTRQSNKGPIANSRSVYTGIAKPTLLYKHSRKPNQVVPSLQIQKHFTIFKLKGNFKTFNLETGKLLQNEDASIRDGDMMFMITGPKSATMFGNAGSAEVELVKDDNFLTFIETTPLGGKHIMIIANEWDAKENGFKCTYIRNIEERIFASELWRTIVNGIAKPAGY